MTDEEIAKARALCEAATPGPWTAEYGTSDRAPTINGPARPGVAGFPVPVRVASNQDAAFIAAARTLVPALLEELESARRDLAIAHQDASQLSGDANRVLRELKERMFAKIERYERDAEALTADIAATKAALAEAVQMIEDIDDTDGLGMLWMIKGLEALKAKVQP